MLAAAWATNPPPPRGNGSEGARGGVGGGREGIVRRPVSRCRCPNPSRRRTRKTWLAFAHSSHSQKSLGMNEWEARRLGWELIPSEAEAEAAAAFFLLPETLGLLLLCPAPR